MPVPGLHCVHLSASFFLSPRFAVQKEVDRKREAEKCLRKGRAGVPILHPSRSDNFCDSQNGEADTEARLFRHSTDDPGFTEPTDKTSLMLETRTYFQRIGWFVTGGNT